MGRKRPWREQELEARAAAEAAAEAEPIGLDDAIEGDGDEPAPDATDGPFEAACDVGADAAGHRLDRFLAAAVAGQTRTRLKALVVEGRVTVDGLPVRDPGAKLKAGARVVVQVPGAMPPEPQGETIPLAIIHEDKDVVVIDKPAGLVVHPSAGHATGTLVNALIAHCGESLSGIGGVRRPGIVHRLDKDTTGLLVVAKNDAAHASLSEQFQAHGADGRLTRAYLAVVWGVPERPLGTVDAALSRSDANRTKIAVVRDGSGRRAVTHWRVLETFAGADGKPVAALLRLELETGRTHQIRVHMAHIGHPLLGDPIYGKGFLTRASRLSAGAAEVLAALGRQALHATELGFEHPRTGRPMVFESPAPDDLARLLNALRATPQPPKGPRRPKRS
ncbi:MAG: RluA family pseudouridine synthase [Hyphomicrobium sp.]|nr:RluA family pseudouridine synthase [Hyphomicrobium sp.]